jgi:hypothetical protein
VCLAVCVCEIVQNFQ